MRLAPGTPLTHWLVSDIVEERYDLPDEAMAGGMDSAFFLTRDRNFIPHEYPCRTHFAATHRSRRPDVRGTPCYTRNWLPFGSPRLDLSGFWFRPTRLAAWARTRVNVAGPGTARLRLATCGGAVLFADGREIGHVAGYVRNREAEAILSVDLAPGLSTLEIFLDDLAERDTRFYVALDWLDGPEVRAIPPFDAQPETVAAIEAALDALHLERPSFTAGEVALRLRVPLPRDGTLAVRVGGSFIGGGAPVEIARPAPAGATRITLGNSTSLPADFRELHVTLALDGFAASRPLGVEIARNPTPPTSLAARVAEALDFVADHGEPDTVTALARLVTGRPGPETEAMIEAMLPAIEDCWDCADFALVPLLWIRARHADALAPALRARVDAAILGYRYWLDEPGNDVQWYFSENHALLFHAAAYLAGHLLPDARFRRSGRSGRDQSATGAARVRAWFDHFERWEMAEFNSAPYFPIDLKGLCTLHALAPDADIRNRAGRGILRLLEIVANSAHHGLLTAAQGRSYEHSLIPALSLELSSIARMLWGRGGFGARFHALPLLALCLRDHGLAVPPDLAARALWDRDTAQEWTFRQGENGFAALYHHKTRAHAMGSAVRYRWGEWGYQETLLHVRIGTEPQAQIWINHPGELIQGGFGRPSYWGGSASVPRVQQYRALALVAFDGTPPQPDLTHAWFPTPAFDETVHDPAAAFARSGDGLATLLADRPLTLVTTGPSAGCELRRAGRHGVWLLRLGDTAAHGDLAAFRRRFAGLAARTTEDGRMIVDDPDYGVVEFHPDGSVAAEGRRLDPAEWTRAGTRRELPAGTR